MEKLVLIGGGGHCKSCIDVIESTNQYQIVGILDKIELLGSKLFAYEVIGTDEDILKYKDCSFLITVGQIKNNAIRKRIYQRLIENQLKLATVISPRAYVSKYSQVGKGSIIMHHAVVNAGVNIGENCIINTASLVEHDATVGSHSHISTGAIINGDCRIGADVFIGSNAIISNETEVCSNVVIGAGAVIVKDIIESGVYLGNPAKSM